MTLMDPGQSTPDGDNRIQVIIDAIRKAYGDDAMLVAQRQVEVAEGDTRDDWIAILDRLRAGSEG